MFYNIQIYNKDLFRPIIIPFIIIKILNVTLYLVQKKVTEYLYQPLVSHPTFVTPLFTV